MWSETRFVGTSLASVKGERLEAGRPGARTASWSPSSAQAGRHPLSAGAVPACGHEEVRVMPTRSKTKNTVGLCPRFLAQSPSNPWNFLSDESVFGWPEGAPVQRTYVYTNEVTLGWHP